MYTLVMTASRSLRTTQQETIFENDDNLNSFRFLIPRTYNGLDMLKFDVIMKYIAPDYQTEYEIVHYENTMFEGMLSIVVPITRKFTYKRGTLKVSLGFISKDNSIVKPPHQNDECIWSEIGDDGSSGKPTKPEYMDVLFATEFASITIHRTEHTCDMSIIDKFLQRVSHVEQTMPDNLVAYPETSEMQLQSQGKPIGDKVRVPCRNNTSGGEDNEWSEIGKYDDGDSDLTWSKI